MSTVFQCTDHAITRLAGDEWQSAAEVYASSFTDDLFVHDVLGVVEGKTICFFQPLLEMTHSFPGAETLALMEEGQIVAAATLLSPEWEPDQSHAMAAYDKVCRGVGLRSALRVSRSLKSAQKLPRPPGDLSHLLFLGTLREARCRGYGTRLLRAVREIALSRNDDGVYLEVVTRSPAKALYLRNGYSEFAQANILKEPVSVMVERWSSRVESEFN